MHIRRRILTGVVAGALGTALVVTAPTADANGTADPVAPIEQSLTGAGDLRAFVKFDAPVADADVAALRAVGITKLHRYDLVPYVAVIAPRTVLERAAAIDGVTRIDEDHGITLNTDQSKAAIKVDKTRAPAPAGLGLTGKGVKVAVIDSGVDTSHPDLDDRVVRSFNYEGGWIFDAYQDGAASDDVAEALAPYAEVDEVGHGSHVAATIAGTGDAAHLPTGSGKDYTGMAPAAEIVNYKIASAAQGVVYDLGWEANAMAAIEHLVENNAELGVKVVSNSWGIFEVTNPDSEPTILMIRAAIAKGLLFVFAAGNNGPDPDTVGWPGAMGNVITVASTLKTAPYESSDFSSRGYQVDVAAPGSDIISARSKVSPIDFGLSVPTVGQDAPFYMAISGTSMATPHVSGVTALLLQANPKLTAPKIEEVLERTAVDLGPKGKDPDYGYGLIDAFKAAKVARCLRTATSADTIERCFTSNNALSRSRWSSDWSDRGDKRPTSQGSVIPL
jgi:serine protease AprX